MGDDAAQARDLLFALQGLQTGLIENDDFLAAIAQWKPENPSSLRETLVARAAVSTDACGVIDSVVVQHVQKHGDLQRSLEKVAGGVDAAVGDALSTLLPTPGDAARDAGTTAGQWVTA